jgi:hypothetical protein
VCVFLCRTGQITYTTGPLTTNPSPQYWSATAPHTGPPVWYLSQINVIGLAPANFDAVTKEGFVSVIASIVGANPTTLTVYALNAKRRMVRVTLNPFSIGRTTCCNRVHTAFETA